MASFNLRIPDELVTGKASTEAQVRSMRKYLYRLNDEFSGKEHKISHSICSDD